MQCNSSRLCLFILAIQSSTKQFHQPVSQLTVRHVPRSWRRVLKDDWHKGLSNGALPCFCHLTSNATVGRNLAWGGRCLWDSLGVALGHRGEGVGILPYKVAHSGCDKLKAVGIGALGDKAEVRSRTQLQDLRKRDLLQVDEWTG